MKKKNGFTLIELLAVIVILAIIALIAVPVIINILNKANKSAFKDTAYAIIKSGDLYYSTQKLSLNGLTETVEFELPQQGDLLGIKGNVPNGKIKINTDGKTTLALYDGRYCITKAYADNDIKIEENYIECNVPGERQVTGTLPLTLVNSKGNNLLQYKIYGNSIASESVGEYDETTGKYKIPVKTRGKNVWNLRNSPSTLIDFYEDYTGFTFKDGWESDFSNGKNIGLLKIYAPDLKVGDQFVLSFETNAVRQGREVSYIYLYNSGDIIKVGQPYICTQEMLDSKIYIYTGDTTDVYFRNIQIETNDKATEYEPYIEPIVTNIYLDEPLRKSGDDVDYIDFKKQTIFRNVGQQKEEQIELPNIPTLEGITVIDVDTSIRPSNMEITYEETAE